MDTEMINPEEVNNTKVNNRILSEEALNLVCKQQDALSDELPQNDHVKQDELRKKWLEQIKNAYGVDLLLGSVYDHNSKKEEPTPGSVINCRAYDEDFYPAKKGLGFREFMYSIPQSVFGIPVYYHRALLVWGPSMIKYRAYVFTTEFVSKSGTQSPLSMGEAFTKFFPQITDIMTIMLCYVLMLWLICPLHPVLQIFFLVMLIATPCYHIPEMMGMASWIDVTCGFFKLPLIWFTVLGGLVLSLICVSLSLLVMYLIKRFIHPGPGGPTVKQFKVNLDAFSDVADMV